MNPVSLSSLFSPQTDPLRLRLQPAPATDQLWLRYSGSDLENLRMPNILRMTNNNKRGRKLHYDLSQTKQSISKLAKARDKDNQSKFELCKCINCIMI